MKHLPILVLLGVLACIAAAPAEESDVSTTTHRWVGSIDDALCTEKKAKEEHHKKLVTTFMQEVFGDKDLTAIDRYLDENTYIQHNPGAKDGRDSVKKVLTDFKIVELPKIKLEVQRVGADGDLVFFHWKSTQLFGKTQSVIDIFRFENGKIVEHWDVKQTLPEKSENDHPLF